MSEPRAKTQIELRGVTRAYGEGDALVRALDDVDLEIRQGDFLALAGPSGSGKTTLLNLVGSIDAPTGGRILFEGTDLGALTDRERTRFRNQRIGFIFQDFNLIPVLSARENAELPLQLLGESSRAERRRASREMLEEVGLGKLAHRLPRELSGGQQQRVAIARALVKRPGVVLADEPTANLDSATAQEILDLMRSFNRSLGTTFVFSTHDPMVMDYARRLVRLRDGKVAAIEEREEE
ncbi:MAG: ABC transporter ATP-binding protein [bacterium]|nr:ABC transporter ATP-binding protein [bacterium]